MSSPRPPLLQVQDLAVSFGGIRAVDHVALTVERQEIRAIIGPNGAGKTTLLNLISGFYRPESGRVLLDGGDITALPPHRLARAGMTRTFQNLQIFTGLTVAENIAVGAHLRMPSGMLGHLLHWPSSRRAERLLKDEAWALAARVGLGGLERALAASLPYGAMRRLEIARALAAQPKILLLDEPAAGCNPTETAEIADLIAGLRAEGLTIVLVEHDMAMVTRLADRILVLDRGKVLAEGLPQAVTRDPKVIAAYLGTPLDPSAAAAAPAAAADADALA